MRFVTRMVMMIALGTMGGAGLAATPAQAKPSLSEVAEIDDGLLAVAVANRIRRKCPDISARMFRAIVFMRALEGRARDMGYSAEEVDAHLDSDVEKARMKKRGAAYLAANGVTGDDPQSYCALGRAEIEKSSQIGTLLKAN